MENLLERSVSKEYGENAGAGLVQIIMGVVLTIILVVGVAIPVTQSVISAANLTGTTATVVGIIPLMLGVAGLYAIFTIF